jgi:hypothetical protein
MKRYWLVLPHGERQQIDPAKTDLGRLATIARRLGAKVIEEVPYTAAAVADPGRFEPPLAALSPLFLRRFDRIHACRVDFTLDINARPTVRVLGGYYRTRRLVRIYSHDRDTGRRPLEELFDTYLHEMAHHLEYTEPDSFRALRCGRVPGRMHSDLFWRILGELKARWLELQRPTPAWLDGI